MEVGLERPFKTLLERGAARNASFIRVNRVIRVMEPFQTNQYTDKHIYRSQ
jgi:hypothetical protein